MTVKELIQELEKMPQDAPVWILVATDFNYETDVLSVDHRTTEWSLRAGKYLETSKVVIS